MKGHHSIYLLSAIFLWISSLGCSGGIPMNLGIKNEKLAACPSSPNCVSTQAKDPTHSIKPFEFHSNIQEAKEKLKRIILSFPRTRIVEEKENYLHAEFKSLIFRFVDDVEFYFDEKNKIIHFRSASRVGYSDLGANRKRMEKIRKAFY
jgi:uncharacterized protein (DUF1499 family)